MGGGRCYELGSWGGRGEVLWTLILGGRCYELWSWGGREVLWTLILGGGGVWPYILGGAHVTYPIMHLDLPLCCLLTNWDWTPVQLLIYCLPSACWDRSHGHISPPPPLSDRMTNTCKNITFTRYATRAVIMGNERIDTMLNWITGRY